MLTARSATNSFLRVLLTVLAVIALSGCIIEELEDNTPASSGEVTIGGSVGDGPVTGSTVTVYNASGDVIDTIVSDSHAKYQARIKAKGRDYPLRLEATGGTDLVTGRAPDFEMVSVIAHPSIKTANINPFSTLIVQVAEQLPGGLDANNVSTATTVVMDKLSFGLDSNRVSDPVTSDITDSNVSHVVKASESMGEMIRRTRDQIQTTGNMLDGDAVMAALAADLTDGVLDGQGSSSADATVTAVAGVVSGQVLVEALSNNLRVDGMVATGVMDQSIVTTHPGVTSALLTGNIRITADMLQQSRTMIAAARVLDSSVPLTNIATVIDGLNANATAASVETVLPASSTLALSGVVGMVPHASPAEINAVINVFATGESPDPQNIPPTISGTAAGSVIAGNGYSFQPTAADADNDSLTFSISNKPGWASFNSGTGRLNGTPTQADSHNNIVISVSDGTDTVSLPAFSVRVDPAPVVNTPPTISGTAAGSVIAGNGYSFQPSASDADNDTLSFSISGRPAWASFNTSTGRLSGTPGDTHTGNYNSIVISVSDGTDTVNLPAFSVSVDPAPVVNTPPVISGTAAGSVIAGNGYSFQPSASDADNDTLAFSISNKPGWASFNSGTGRLDGTPTQAGSHNNVVISVSDGTDTVSLPAFSIQVNASTGSFSLSWTAPTTRADGTPISLAEIDGYRVYYGTTSGNYPNSVDITDGTATGTTINNIPVGNYSVVMTTYDNSGMESAQSGVVNKQAQ